MDSMGSMNPWIQSMDSVDSMESMDSMDPWTHGSMDRWIHGFCLNPAKTIRFSSKAIKNIHIRLPESPKAIDAHGSPRACISSALEISGEARFQGGIRIVVGSAAQEGARKRAVPGSIPPSRGVFFYKHKHTNTGEVRFWGLFWDHFGVIVGSFGDHSLALARGCRRPCLP